MPIIVRNIIMAFGRFNFIFLLKKKLFRTRKNVIFFVILLCRFREQSIHMGLLNVISIPAALKTLAEELQIFLV